MRRQTIAWTLYDFANSAYGSLIPVLLFPLYFKSVILDNGPKVDLWWGIAAGVSILISGLLAPFIGALADSSQRRKLLFTLFSLLAIAGTAALALSGGLSPMSATLLFICTNTLYNVSLVLYDSLLSHVAPREQIGAISGLGWGLGYAGAVLCMFLVLPYLRAGVEDPSYSLVFLIVAAFFLLFSLPAYLVLRESRGKRIRFATALGASWSNVFSTLRDWRSHKQIMVFLIAFYFFTEGISTIFYFLGLYAATTLGISLVNIALLIALNMTVALPVTIIVGRYSDRIGHRRIIMVSIAIWVLTVLIMAAATTLAHIITAAVVAGFAIGTGQASARAWFSNIIPEAKRSQLFGFNALASKVSATMGPVLFGVISVATGNQRIAVLFILVYFAISFVLFLRVRQ